MSDFERALPPYRLAKTHYGDTLQDVATRELGDANRWIELIWLNGLTYPYLVDTDDVPAGTIRNGSNIRVPSVLGVADDTSADEEGYETDCLLKNRRLVDDGNGDFAMVSGVANLKQQIAHRIDTPMGQARRHPLYGCRVWLLRGKVNGPLAGMLGARYVKASVMADYRIAQVTSATADVVGDTVRVTVKASAAAGHEVDVVTPNS